MDVSENPANGGVNDDIIKDVVTIHQRSNLRYNDNLKVFYTTKLEKQLSGEEERDFKYSNDHINLAMQIHSNNLSYPISLVLGNLSNEPGMSGTLVCSSIQQLARQCLMGAIKDKKINATITTVLAKGYTKIPIKQKKYPKTNALFPPIQNVDKNPPRCQTLLSTDRVIGFGDIITQQTKLRSYKLKYGKYWLSENERRNLVKTIMTSAPLKGIDTASVALQLKIVYTEVQCQETSCACNDLFGHRGLIGLPPLLFEEDKIRKANYCMLDRIINTVSRMYQIVKQFQNPTQLGDGDSNRSKEEITLPIGRVIGERNQHLVTENFKVHPQCMLCMLRSHNKCTEPTGTAVKMYDINTLKQSYNSSQGFVKPMIYLLPPEIIMLEGFTNDEVLSGEFVINISPTLSKIKRYKYFVSSIAKKYCLPSVEIH